MKHGIVLGKLAPPFKEGMVLINGLFRDERELSRRCKKSVHSDDYDYRDDPMYFAAENKRKRRANEKTRRSV